MAVTLMRIVLGAALASSACARRPTPAVRLRVAAAISLKEPLEELARAYERAHPEVAVSFVFGASGDLAAQIRRGAPVALFASASEEAIERLATQAPTTRLCVLAENELVLIRRAGDDLRGLAWSNLTTHPGVRRVALGIVPVVPAGAYAERTLQNLGALDALSARLVRAGNVRGVLELVARAEADAGFVYATDLRGRSDVILVGGAPTRARQRVVYPLVEVGADAGAGPARALGLWLCGADPGRVLRAHGFAAPAR